MLKFVLLPMVVGIVLSACSSNQPPSKYNDQGDYIGWHCAADTAIPTDWRCVQKIKQIKDSSSDDDMRASATEVASNLSESSLTEPTSKSEMSLLEVVDISATTGEVSKSEGYQLQLGAYSSYKDATTAVKQIDAADDLKITPLWSRQSQFFVILYGYYGTRDEAQRAALLLMEANPSLSYWIRSSTSINKAQSK